MRKPAGTSSTDWKLRSVRPAATSSSEASAISETTSATRSARRTPPGERPPSFSDADTSWLARCHAGRKPNRSPSAATARR